MNTLPPFLRVPPFPGRQVHTLAHPGTGQPDPAEIAAALVRAQVGGTFWGTQPVLPDGDVIVLAADTPQQLAEMQAALAGRTAITLPAGSDPWWIAGQARAVWAGADQELALIAALSGTPLRLFGAGRFDGCNADAAAVAARVVGDWAYRDPFSGADWTGADAIALLADWRRLIDANRTIAAVFGVAWWKRETLDAVLWDGTGPVRHAARVPAALGPASRVIAWKTRTNPAVLAELGARGCGVGELEDGMIRSTGLGANCVPPLSAIVDFSGVYFDPAGPSDLEMLLETAEIGPDLCARAAALREELVRGAISKYGQGGAAIARTEDNRRRVLVTGQVEDDRSILSGGGGMTNLALLTRARELEPDAWIVFKPHPDVMAGHRKGHVPLDQALGLADEVLPDAPIIPLIDSVDALHVITSLAGFEALLRGKPVTTHGMPFYAGWGLTRDLALIPPRRTRRRTLDELVAGALLLYPRYLDPITRLPCPAEVVVRRMARGQAEFTSPLIALRQWQGRARLAWRRLAGAA
ncbi:capsular polysaccharide export protein, LipB/KpsS family [Novosphingobium arvoryzae]|uniref:Capsular polysaccharide export protein n=1 Tax=Novosphingobium arvoryzae TaxID=1256514 RepID=A0A918R5A5_9SPHN|nr:beta-3-deoxy-D-manno-oct-2-ulosonic acid transferase [Novosphingobium arvoryzae]GGZ85835.1 hypothetical protein GCM10011617_00320 [Novosphingobium arvoryzae]